jgi:hypothetical protein
MKRAVIKATSENTVSVEFNNPLTQEREKFEVHVPYSGGYVTFCRSGNQVCEGLSTMGNTLCYRGSMEGFLGFIRAEYRVMMRSLKNN